MLFGRVAKFHLLQCEMQFFLVCIRSHHSAVFCRLFRRCTAFLLRLFGIALLLTVCFPLRASAFELSKNNALQLASSLHNMKKLQDQHGRCNNDAASNAASIERRTWLRRRSASQTQAKHAVANKSCKFVTHIFLHCVGSSVRERLRHRSSESNMITMRIAI